MVRNLFVLLGILFFQTGCSIRLVNVPGEATGFSNVTNMDVTVESDATITGYQFRVVPSDSPDADCTANLASYGPMLSVGTHLIKDLSPMADGPLTLCANAVGAVNVITNGVPSQSHFSTRATAHWTKDTVAPGAFTITGPSGTQTSNTPTITWSAASGADNYSIDITSDAACQNIYKHFDSIQDTTYKITDGLANGFWHVCLKAQDLATNATAATNNGILMTVDAPFHYLFATSDVFSGSDVGAISDADNNCTLYAFLGNLIPDWDGVSTVYKAVVSTSGSNAKDRLVLDRSIFNRNNELVTFGTGLWSGILSKAIAYDENAFLLGNVSAWTGSQVDGTFSGQSCSDWSSTSGLGTSGLLSATDGTWIQSSDEACSSNKHIYCIGPF